MGLLIDLLKSAAGEDSLLSRLGAWRQKVSQAGDQATVDISALQTLEAQDAANITVLQAEVTDLESKTSGIVNSQLNSLASTDLASQAWTILAPTLAFDVRRVNGANSPYDDAEIANPYGTAPGGGLRSFLVCAPPGATSITLRATMALPTGVGASTVALAIYDATGAVQLAVTPAVLTAAQTEYTVTAPVVPGTSYQCWVAVNDPGIGSSVQASAEVNALSVTAAGASGVFAGPYARIEATPQALSDNAEAVPGSDVQSCFARFVVDTDAPSLVVEASTTLLPLYPGSATMGVRVNGRWVQVFDPPAPGVFFATIDLSAFPGHKRVEIITGAPVAPGTNPLGSFILALYFSTRLVNATPLIDMPGRKILVYGDSIVAGFNIPAGLQGAWTSRLRDRYPGNVQVEAYAGRTLHDDAATAAQRLVFARKLAAQRPDDIWIAVGTNDWGTNAWTAAAFGTALADLLDQIHAAIPGAKIWVQSPILRTGEGVPNGSGDTLAAFRTQMITAVSTRTSYSTHVYGAALLSLSEEVPSDYGGDGIHPNYAGHDRLERRIAAILGLGQAQSNPNTVVMPGETLWDYYESDALAAGALAAWPALANGGNLLQANGALQGTVILNQVNGLPCVRFNGAQWMAVAKALPKPTTVVVVMRMIAITVPGSGDIVYDGFTNVASLVAATDNAPSTYIGSGGSTVVKATSLLTTKYQSLVGVFNGLAPASRIDFADIPTTGTTAAATAGGFTLANLNNGAGRGVAADFAGIYIYTTALTRDNEAQLVEGYIRPKYAF